MEDHDLPDGLDREDEDSDPLLKILGEKDKLIVSLKEASTRRDKLNEQQIKLLSVDNQKKSLSLKTFQNKLKDLDYKILKRESELSVYKVANEKITEKLAHLRSEILNYKKNIQLEFRQLNDLFQNELSERDKFADQVTQQFKGTIEKLETKISEVEKHYEGVVDRIKEKQTGAKRLIREAIDKLQDAMSFLDLADVEFFAPKRIEEEVGQIMDTTRKTIQRTEETVRSEKAGETIIKNIENVNIRLMSNPAIENILSDITQVRSSAAKELDKVRTMAPGQPAKAGSGFFEDSGGPEKELEKGALGRRETMESLQEQRKQQAQKPRDGKGKDDKGGDDGDKGAPQQPPPSQPAPDAGAPGAGEEAGGGEDSGLLSDLDQYLKDQEEENKQRTIMDKDNFAPFDWDRLLNDLQLRKYGDLIRKCNRAIKHGEYLRAIKLFRAIREQPGISEESITREMIDEEIEFLEKFIKDKYTRRPGRKTLSERKEQEEPLATVPVQPVMETI